MYQIHFTRKKESLTNDKAATLTRSLFSPTAKEEKQVWPKKFDDNDSKSDKKSIEENNSNKTSTTNVSTLRSHSVDTSNNSAKNSNGLVVIDYDGSAPETHSDFASDGGYPS